MVQCLAVASCVLGLLAADARGDVPSANVQQLAKAHFKLGAAHFTAGDYDHAIMEYQEAYTLLPLPDILFNLGQAYRMVGKKKEALDYYTRYVAARPDGRGAREAREYIESLSHDSQARPDAGADALAPATAAPTAPVAAPASSPPLATELPASTPTTQPPTAEAVAVVPAAAPIETPPATPAALTQIPSSASDTTHVTHRRWLPWLGVAVGAVLVGTAIAVTIAATRSDEALLPTMSAR